MPIANAHGDFNRAHRKVNRANKIGKTGSKIPINPKEGSRRMVTIKPKITVMLCPNHQPA